MLHPKDMAPLCTFTPEEIADLRRALVADEMQQQITDDEIRQMTIDTVDLILALSAAAEEAEE